MKKDKKNKSGNFFKDNKTLLIVSGVIIVVVIIAAIVAVSIIKNNKEQERIKQEQEQQAALMENFKAKYLLTTGDFTEEQGECVWGQVKSLVNDDDILAAAEEYEEKGVIDSKSAFANKIYPSIENIYKKCEVKVEDAEKSLDKITNVIDLTMSGFGTSSTEVFELQRGLADITITGVGSVGFELQSTSNGYTGCSDYFGDSYSGSGTYTKKCTIDRAGEYYVDIHNYTGSGAGGDWTFHIRQEG